MKEKLISMEKIHLLPTDKPSRLGYLTKKGKEVYKDLRLFEKPMPNILDSENQNIYITSEEEIKEGDWVIKISSLYKGGGSIQKYSFIDRQFEDITFKKIILTTDQDLIKDGVQAIDDEFLEWFVKNPSCEYVEVNKRYSDFTVDPFVGYKIIIPKEEPKQELLPDFKITKNIFDFVTDLSDTKKEEPVSFESFDKEKSEAITTMGQKLVRELQSSMKQETLEEATERLIKLSRQDGFYEGAKWQQERMYSEEDIENIWNEFVKELPPINNGASSDFLVYLKQFKKK